ncbi:ComF family protein [Alteriqipengyuania flavescens]|uniref:ComF family protein n=1 Tax=Alteriqipengyuania flavescens TaxID=3053610 RepID=UPI0025B57928|nr:ComF family protein [Alteriqipengyuania flavescens]WJY18291.1 ComF family protein [Alteriqipengyuania flavescens]WJY24232.1 ComF family protein [Alteriqipengyuania flavescens]
MQVLRPIGDALKPVVDLVYPPRCPLCGAAIGEQGGLCQPCWGELAIPGDPNCTSCQRPLGHGAQDGMTCAVCLTYPPRHDGIAAATLYNDASRKLVLAFKHGKRIALSRLMARLMLRRLGALSEDTLLAPVPLHRVRLWQRGFNQSALLAREIERMSGASLALDALRRTRPTPSLGGLSRKQRAKALQGAIIVAPNWAARLKDRDVVLVDDVLTSGATTEACVRALKKAGARRVTIACFARVLDEALPHAEPVPPPM